MSKGKDILGNAVESSNNGNVAVAQDDKAIIAEIVSGQGTVSDASTAMSDQELIVNAISEDSVCVELKTGSPLGATLVAFNQTAKKHGRKEMSPQEWAEIAIATGLLALKRSWEYTAVTRNTKAFVDEMKTIAKLFTVPTPEHPKYLERMSARFEAEQNCRAKYGIQ